MKGRCKTGCVQCSEASAPPRCWLSPARSRGQPGPGRRRCGSAAAPRAPCGAGQPGPPGERGQAWDTAHSCCGGAGAAWSPAGSGGMDGVGSDGAERGGQSCPPSLGPDGISGMEPSRGRGKGVPAPLAALLVADRTSIPAPGQCPPVVSGTVPLLAAMGGEKLRPGATGDTALGHSLTEAPGLQPAQLTCQVRQVAHGAGHAGSALPWQLQCAVLCREAGGGSPSIVGLLQGDRAVLTLGLLLCSVLPSRCPKAPLPFSSSWSRAASPQHSPHPSLTHQQDIFHHNHPLQEGKEHKKVSPAP